MTSGETCIVFETASINPKETITVVACCVDIRFEPQAWANRRLGIGRDSVRPIPSKLYASASEGKHFSNTHRTGTGPCMASARRSAEKARLRGAEG